MEAVVPIDVVVPVAPLGPAPVPGPLILMEPVYDIGIQKAEIAPTSKSACIHCKVKMPKGDARLVYHPAKSVYRYIHPGCCAGVADELIPHSRAMLTYQRDVVAGHHMLVLEDAIAAALALLV